MDACVACCRGSASSEAGESAEAGVSTQPSVWCVRLPFNYTEAGDCVGVGASAETETEAEAAVDDCGACCVNGGREHNMVLTCVQSEGDRGDIDCRLCDRRGPSRYTSHKYCSTCGACGFCALDWPCVDMPAAEDDDSFYLDNDAEHAGDADFDNEPRFFHGPLLPSERMHAAAYEALFGRHHVLLDSYYGWWYQVIGKE